MRAGLHLHPGTPLTPANMIAAIEQARASGEALGAVPVASMSAEGSTWC